MTTNNTKDIWEDRFDETFGKDGPDRNSDSIGRMAGCDDCFKNIELRAEHKQFVRETLLSQKRELVEEIQAIRNKYQCAACSGAKCGHTFGCKTLSDILSIINKKI